MPSNLHGGYLSDILAVVVAFALVVSLIPVVPAQAYATSSDASSAEVASNPPEAEAVSLANSEGGEQETDQANDGGQGTSAATAADGGAVQDEPSSLTSEGNVSDEGQQAVTEDSAEPEEAADEDASEVEDSTDACEHVWDAGTVTAEPTCGAEGATTYTCTVEGCDETKTEPIAATGNHVWDGTSCSVCGKSAFIYAKSDAGIAITGLSSEVSGRVTVPATIEDIKVVVIGEKAFYNRTDITRVTLPEGITTIKARAFYRSGIDEITIPESVTSIEAKAFYQSPLDGGITFKGAAPALDAAVFEGLSTTVYYRSAAAGWTGETGAAQGLYGANSIIWEGIEHVCMWNEGEVTTAPTCEVEGVRTFTCTVGGCAKTKTEAVAAAGHNLKELVLAEPDCVTVGRVLNACTNEGCTYVTSSIVAALGHSWDGGKITVEPGCETTGATLHACQRESCDATDERTVAALGHTWNEGEQTTAPGCETEGTMTFKCVVDGCEGEKTEPIAATGHSFIEGSDCCQNEGCKQHYYKYEEVTGGIKLTQCLIDLEGDVAVPAEIDGKKVVAIGDNLFKGESVITSVSLPESVTSIGANAFNGCSALKNINLPDGLTSIGSYAFNNCSALASIAIPAGVATVEDYSFNNCSALASVSLPSGLTSIGNYAFSGCSALATIEIPARVASIGNYAFNNCKALTGLAVPASVKTIGDYAFQNCTKISNVTFAEGLATIGASAFKGCTSLKEANLPNGLTKIGNYAFDGCRSLTYVYVPGTVTDWGTNSFRNGSKISSIVIGEGVTAIPNAAFYSCTSLASLSLPSTLKTIGSSAFGCDTTAGVSTPLSEVNLPNGLETIGNSAFSGQGLVKVVVPDSVTNIGQGFSQCLKLEEITLPSGLTELPVHALYRCHSLRTLIIPATVTKVGAYSINGCYGLSAVYFLGDMPELPIQKGGTGYWVDDETGVKPCYYPADNDTWDTSYLAQVTRTKWYEYDHICQWAEEGSVTKEPTCTEPGFKEFKCTHEGCEETNIELVSALGHSYDENGMCTVEGCTGYRLYVKQVEGGVAITGMYSDVKGDVEIPATVKGSFDESGAFAPSANGTEYAVVAIAEGAFKSNTAIGNVKLPASVKTIEASAFEASSVTGINLANVTSVGEKAFYGSGLTSITIPATLTSVGSQAFASCAAMRTATIESGVTAIATRMFEGSAIERITLPATVTEIGAKAFYNSGLTSIEASDIPVGLTTVGSYAFGSCPSLTSVVLPEGLKLTGSYMFAQCPSLSTVSIPGSIETWGNFEFFRCTGLTSVTLADSLTSLGGSMFAGNWSEKSGLELETVKLPGSLKEIPTNLFAYSGIKTVEIPASVTKINTAAFQASNIEFIEVPGTVKEIGANVFRQCTGLKEVTLNEGLESIGTWAFWGASSLTTVNNLFPSTVKVIGADGEAMFLNTKLGGHVTIPADVSLPDGNSGRYSLFYGTNIESVTFTEGVKDVRVGVAVFQNCKSLKSVTFAKNVKVIGQDSFASTAVESVDLTNVATLETGAFSGCKNLTEVSIPGTVTELGGGAFSGCTNIKKATLGEGITKLPGSLFSNTAIEEIVLPSTLKELSAGAFSSMKSLRTIQLPATLTEIPNSLFSGCSSLEGVNIPAAVTSIGQQAFSGCKVLESLALPDGVTSIGRNAFQNCTVLTFTSTKLPSKLTSIGQFAFQNCDAITELVVPAGVTEITEQGVFSNCDKLETITFEGIVTLGSPDNYTGVLQSCTSLAEVNLPDSLKTLGKNVFSGCKALDSFIAPSSLETIGTQTFLNCTSLSNLNLNDGLKTIGDLAFQGCTVLERVVLPDTLTALGAGAFYNCTALSDVRLSDSLESLQIHAFKGCASLEKLSIPASVTALAWTMNYTLGYTDYWPASMKEITFEGKLPPTFAQMHGTDVSFRGLSDATIYYPAVSLEWCDLAEQQPQHGGKNLKWVSYGHECEWKVAHTVLPTCTEKGLDTYSCTTCANKDTREVDALGHLYEDEDYICDREIPEGEHAGEKCASHAMSFAVNGEGTAKLTAFSSDYPHSALIVPATIDGKYVEGGVEGTSYTVTEIGSQIVYQRWGVNNFANQFTSLEIPTTVTSIGNYAFYNLKNVTSLELHDGLTSIGNGAFAGLGDRNLEKIVIPDSVTFLGTSAIPYATEIYVGVERCGLQSISASMFAGCKKMICADGPTSIGAMGVAGLEEIRLPGTIKEIPYHCFYKHTTLTKVHIPNGVEVIGGGAFTFCAISELNMPASLKRIERRAFAWCSGITELVFPAGIEYVGEAAFAQCGIRTMSFTGDAPYFYPANGGTYDINNSASHEGRLTATGCFFGMNIVANYWPTNATWTPDVLTYQGDGKVTWVPRTVEYEEEEDPYAPGTGGGENGGAGSDGSGNDASSDNESGGIVNENAVLTNDPSAASEEVLTSDEPTAVEAGKAGGKQEQIEEEKKAEPELTLIEQIQKTFEQPAVQRGLAALVAAAVLAFVLLGVWRRKKKSDEQVS